MPDPSRMQRALLAIRRHYDEHDIDCEEGTGSDRCVPCLAGWGLGELDHLPGEENLGYGTVSSASQTVTDQQRAPEEASRQGAITSHVNALRRAIALRDEDGIELYLATLESFARSASRKSPPDTDPELS